jgi:predicted metal-dependent HD superfamily phosphohydrolase
VARRPRRPWSPPPAETPRPTSAAGVPRDAQGADWHSDRMDALRVRWRADCTPVAGGAPADTVDDVGTDLLRRWHEPHRRYHATTHLAEVLAAVDELCAAGAVNGTSRSVAALAAWFHDAVYDVDPDNANEAESASLAARQLGRLPVDPELTARVVAVVLDTASHELTPQAAADPARVVVHDADLWVLSAPVDRFDEYCAQVREEYAHVPMALYATARSKVLRPFLVRDHVYRTSHARSEWEPAARENLARELTRLAG